MDDRRSSGASTLTEATAPLSFCSVLVTSAETRRAADGAFAIYVLRVTTEAGAEWTCERRWSDLKLAAEALALAHGATLEAHRRRIPAFERSSWRDAPGLGFAKFDSKFLDARAEQMQTVVQAWMDVFGVQLEGAPCGPDALLAFLLPDPAPAAAPSTTIHGLALEDEEALAAGALGGGGGARGACGLLSCAGPRKEGRERKCLEFFL
jgi:hypothetical protein